MNNTSRPLSQIAKEIKNDWKKVYFGAVPYLDAMLTSSMILESQLFFTFLPMPKLGKVKRQEESKKN
jgi:hypothetical protein